MKKILLFIPLFFFALLLKAQEADTLGQAADKKAIKAVLEKVLTAVGNYDAVALEKLCLPKANIIGRTFSKGQWTGFNATMDEFMAEMESAPATKKYKETANQWSISVDNGQIAFARADATLSRSGSPQSHNIDYFTLVKEKGSWKLLCAAYTAMPIATK